MNLESFSASSLLAGLIFGIIGFYLFRKGKKDTDFEVIFIGIALMVYPYFTSGARWDWGIGIGLCLIAYLRR